MSDIFKKVFAIIFSLLLIAVAFIAIRALFLWLEVDLNYGNIFGLIVIAVVLAVFTRFLRVE